MTDDLQRLQLAGRASRAAALKLRKGKIDIVIHRDGHWSYRGTPILREAMVRLFAQQLWLFEGHYYIQAPEQLLRIEVEDLPYTVITASRVNSSSGQRIVVQTNCAGEVTVGEAHPLVLSKPSARAEALPAVLVRDNLYARVLRNPYYQLVEWGEPGEINGQPTLILHSQNCRYALGEL
ncbi:MAG: DUF1285 domain-containing protein [Gammaproteobacteria bacterium]|nr:DUF1285 domain-containing protein [Gammaproteobacteria bacterium]